MKILYFTHSYTTHDRRFLEKLAQTQHQVWFLTQEKESIQREKRPIPANIQTVSWDRTYKTGILSQKERLNHFKKIITTIQPNIIHAGPIQSCGYLSALSQFHPLLLMSWGSDLLVDADRNRLWQSITRFTLKSANMIVCDCQAVEDKVAQIIDTPPPIITFPWGIDLKQFAPKKSPLNLRQELGWEKKAILISTRSWEPIYGIDILLKAFNTLRKTVPEARLLLLGNGTLAPKILTYIKNNNLIPFIHCPGQIPHDQLPHYFNLADMYVSTSHSDGSSISLLEAMACGLPVVVSDILGNKEWVIPKYNGWLFSTGNVSSLTSHLIQALKEQAHWSYFSKNNITTTQKRAHWDHNFQKLLTGYERLYAA